MRRPWRLTILLVAGLGVLAAASVEGQTQPRRPPQVRDDPGADARMLADLEILRDLELLKQLDLLRRLDEVRGETPSRPTGAEERGRGKEKP